jgi:hypothetical protein
VELVTAQEEVTSLADKTRGLEDGLALVSTEQDALKAEAEREAAAAQSICAELARIKMELQLKDGVMAQAIQLAEAACAETLQWKQKVGGNVSSTVFPGFGCCFSSYPLVSILEQAWRKIWSTPSWPLACYR